MNIFSIEKQIKGRDFCQGESFQKRKENAVERFSLYLSFNLCYLHSLMQICVFAEIKKVNRESQKKVYNYYCEMSDGKY